MCWFADCVDAWVAEAEAEAEAVAAAPATAAIAAAKMTSQRRVRNF